MTPTFQELKTTASGLPAAQRAELAHFLLQTLEVGPEEWTESWREELDRRLHEIKTGRVVGVPAEEVLARLRERYP